MKYTIILFLCLILPVGAEERPLTFAYASGENSAVVHEKFSPMISLLSEKLEREITFVYSYSYKETQEAFTEGSADMGILNTLSFIKLMDNPRILPVASRIKYGSGNYRSYIIVKKNSHIESYSDLKGKVFAFGDPYSTSATLMPKILLESMGLFEEDGISRVLYFSKQDSILYAILNNTADAGAIASFIFDEYDKEVTNRFTIVDQSESFPLGPFVVRKDLGEDLILRIRAVLLSLSSSSRGRSALKKADLDHFSEVETEEYKKISLLYNSLNDDIK